MPTEHTTEQDTEFDIPEDAGLPAEPRATPEAPSRGGADLLNAAAAGHAVSQAEHEGLVDYFLANGELPGDSEPTRLSVKLGRKDNSREFRCEVRAITWDEWQDARKHATNDDTSDFDVYVQSCWVVARALVTPKLGPVVMRQQQEASEEPDGKLPGPGGQRIKPPAHAADLLGRMFARQSGALLELAGKVLELSGLQDGAPSVTEIDAAKN